MGEPGEAGGADGEWKPDFLKKKNMGQRSFKGAGKRADISEG